jgi:hypothetical protein
LFSNKFLTDCKLVQLRNMPEQLFILLSISDVLLKSFKDIQPLKQLSQVSSIFGN